MTQFELKEQIDANNAMIEDLIDPTQFTLNPIVANLLHENAKLQHVCQHEFEDGVCKWCGIIEKEIK